jgi:NitT/TauT family transport system ATP-binding protein
MSDAIIQARNLKKMYKTGKAVMEAVADVTLDVMEKEFLVIMGPSSCGKSTLLKLLAGLESIDAGTLHICDTDCCLVYPNDMKRRIGFMYQNENLIPWRSVEKNLRLPFEIFKTLDDSTEKRIRDMLELVGLTEYSEVLPNELSGGMKQRVGIARALVYNPQIVLMDQPFGALDAITRKMLSYDFLHIWQKTQKTFIMTTNNINEALLCGSRIVFLTGSPARVKEIVDVDIPMEKRDENIQLLPQYWKIRKRAQELTMGENQTGGSRP